MIRDGLFMLAEAAWLIAPLVLIDAALPGAAPPLYLFLALYPVAYLAARHIPIRDERVWVEVAVSAGLYFAALIALAAASWLAGAGGEHPGPRFAFVAIVGAIAWIRGWLLGRRAPDLKDFALTFQFGLMVVATALFFAPGLDVAASTQIATALGLVVFGLGGLWHARAAAGGAHGRQGDPASAVIALLAVFTLGAAFWLLLDRAALEAGLAALGWLQRQIFGVFVWLMSLLPEATNPPGEMAQPQVSDAVPEPQREWTEPRWDPPVWLKWIGLAVILGGLAACIGLVAYHLIRALGGRGGRRRTPGLTYGRAGGGALAGLVALMRRVAHWVKAGIAARIARFRRGREPGSVRGRYARLSGLLSRRGWPRRAYETPTEYHRRVAPAWAEAEPHFSELTAAFVAARYGGREPERDAVETLWLRLRSVAGKLRRANG